MITMEFLRYAAWVEMGGRETRVVDGAKVTNIE